MIVRLGPELRVRGRLTSASGTALSGAYVTAVAIAPGTTADDVGYPGAWGPPIVAVTDTSGAFRVSGLDEGPHVIRAWATGTSSQARVVSVPEDSGATFVIAPEPDTTDR